MKSAPRCRLACFRRRLTDGGSIGCCTAAVPVQSRHCAMMSSVTLPAGQANRQAGIHVSYAQPPGSLGTRALGVFEGPSIWSFSIANVMLPEVRKSFCSSRANNMRTHRLTLLSTVHGRSPPILSPDADPVGGQASGGLKWKEGLRRSAHIHRHLLLAHLPHRLLGVGISRQPAVPTQRCRLMQRQIVSCYHGGSYNHGGG
jgi:hypothetical protein